MGNMKDIGLACEEYDVPPVGIRVEELLEIMEGRGRGRGAGMRGGAGAPGGSVAEVDGEVVQGASGVDGFRGGFARRGREAREEALSRRETRPEGRGRMPHLRKRKDERVAGRAGRPSPR